MSAPSLRGAGLRTIDTLIALAEQDVQRHKASAENAPNNSTRAGDDARTFMKLSAEARVVANWLVAARRSAAAMQARETADA